MAAVSVSLAEFKAYARITITALDSTILPVILEAAEQFVFGECQHTITKADFTDVVDGGGRTLFCPHRPVREVTKVTDNWDASEVDSDEYATTEWGPDRQYSEIDWEQGERRYTVEYSAGYDSETEGQKIPAALKLVVIQLATRWFENRDGRQSEGGATGGSINWAKFLDTDMVRTINYFAHRRRFV